MNRLKVRLLVLFPYSAHSERVFGILADVLDRAEEQGLHTSHRPPLLVVNADSEREGHLREFREYISKARPQLTTNSYDVHCAWSPDTCAMWLSGWGRILADNWSTEDKGERDHGILQV